MGPPFALPDNKISGRRKNRIRTTRERDRDREGDWRARKTSELACRTRGIAIRIEERFCKKERTRAKREVLRLSKSQLSNSGGA